MKKFWEILKKFKDVILLVIITVLFAILLGQCGRANRLNDEIDRMKNNEKALTEQIVNYKDELGRSNAEKHAYQLTQKELRDSIGLLKEKNMEYLTYLNSQMNITDTVTVETVIVKEVDAEVAVEIVVGDTGRAVGHTVHGSCVNMPVVFDQYSPAFPAPVAVDLLHDRRVIAGGRLRVDMVSAAPPFNGEDLAGFNILYLESGALGNLAAAAVKPVQPLRSRTAAAAVGSIGLFGPGGIQLRQGFAVDLAVGRQAVAFLEGFHRGLGTVAVVPVHAAGVIAELFQPFLNLFDGFTAVSRGAGTVGAFLFGAGRLGGGFGGLGRAVRGTSDLDIFLGNIAGFAVGAHFIPAAGGILDGDGGAFL